MAQMEQQNVTPQQMLELMKQFAKELKKPTDEEQAKIDADKARMMENQQRSIDTARRQEQQKAAEQAMCSHMKPHPYQGRTRIVAPLHNDGLHHPRCLFCHKEFKPFPPGPETIPMGMSLDDFTGITPQIVEHWGSRYESSKLVK